MASMNCSDASDLAASQRRASGAGLMGSVATTIVHRRISGAALFAGAPVAQRGRFFCATEGFDLKSKCTGAHATARLVNQRAQHVHLPFRSQVNCARLAQIGHTEIPT